MPWIISKPERLEGQDTVGVGPQQVNKGECAALAQGLGKGVPHVAAWKGGAQVKQNRNLMPGTVIAVFNKNGDYVGQKHHAHPPGTAHTALYVGQTNEGMWVIHQYKNNSKIKRTFIRFGGRFGVSSVGNTLEDDANNYFVVEPR